MVSNSNSEERTEDDVDIQPENYRIVLDAEQWEVFLKELDAPPRRLPRIERLMREPSFIENGQID